MTSYQQAKDFIVTTDANTNKNLASNTSVFAQAGISIPAGSYTSRSYNVSLSEQTRLYQIYVNLSIDGDYWTAIPARDRQYSDNRRIAMNIAQSGTNITLDIYYVNVDGVTRSFPAMNVSIAKRDFIDEI